MKPMDSQQMEIQLLTVIVKFGEGSHVLRIAKKQGVSGGTMLLGVGMVKNRILEALGLSDERKELVLMVAEAAVIAKAVTALDAHYQFEKKHHGVAFTSAICDYYGGQSAQLDQLQPVRSETKMYHSIFAIVDLGKAELVIDAATLAGSRGGTVIHARGSGVHETSTVFGMEIEPEKEVVLILVKSEKLEDIAQAIREKLEIDQPGAGILFTQKLDQVFGVYDD